MTTLFLDPLALTLLVLLLAYVWIVRRGTFRRWFGRPEPWTVLAWPVPLLAIGVPPVAASLLWFAGRVGVEIGDGGVADAGLYAAAYLVPATILSVWPPRWLLPGWARGRVTSLPHERGRDAPAGAMPAVHGGRGHGSRGRWVWRVDAVAGHVWVDGSALRFRAAATPDPSARIEVDTEAVAGLHLSGEGELRLQAPRGGWWSRGQLDVALDEVDHVRLRAAVPWRRDGLVSLEVSGRQPQHLWVADVRGLERSLTEVVGDRSG